MDKLLCMDCRWLDTRSKTCMQFFGKKGELTLDDIACQYYSERRVQNGSDEQHEGRYDWES